MQLNPNQPGSWQLDALYYCPVDPAVEFGRSNVDRILTMGLPGYWGVGVTYAVDSVRVLWEPKIELSLRAKPRLHAISHRLPVYTSTRHLECVDM